MGDAKDMAQAQVGQVADKGRGAVRSQVDQRSTQAGSQAQMLADTLRQTASQLRAEGDQQKARYAEIADQGADRLDRVGEYLTNADADEILGKVEDVARRQPWLSAGAGLLVGIAAARVMKASSSQRYHRTQPVAGLAETRRPVALPAAEYHPAAARPLDELR
jgi:ElaB/YqjD/DUF883 family membrane-anchored ribosome-binding protein